MRVDAGFIVGFDNDPPSIFEKLSAFIQESGIVTAMVGLLNAPRGTGLFSRLLKEDRILEDINGNNTDLSTNFIPKMGAEKLINGYKQVISGIYSPEHYYKRVGQFIRRFIPSEKIKFHFQLNHVKAILKTFLQIGIVGKERKHFWKLFFRTLFKEPKKIPMAITFAIYGFHFRKVFKNCMLPC